MGDSFTWNLKVAAVALWRRRSRAPPCKLQTRKVMAPKRKVEQTKKKADVSTEVERLEAQFPGFSFRNPTGEESHLSAKEGELCIFHSHLKAGLTFPLPSHLTILLKYCKMVPAQLTPNSIENLSGVYKLMDLWKVVWSIPNILSLLKVSTQEKEFYFVQPRQPSRMSLSGTPRGLHGWKGKFYFVKSSRPWGIDTVPREVNLKALLQKEITAEIENFYKEMQCSYFDLNVRTLAVKSSHEPRAIGGKKASGSLKEGQEASQEAVKGGGKVIATPSKKGKTPAKAARPKRRKVVISEDESESLGDDDEDDTDEEEVGGGEEEGEDDTDGASSSSSSDKEVAQGSQGMAPPRREGKEEVAQESQGEAPPSKEREEEVASAGFWVDEDEGTFTFRSNRPEAVIPKGGTPAMPMHLLNALMTSLDKEYLDSLPDLRLTALQGQLAIGSALVASYIAEGSRERLKVLMDGKKEIEMLKTKEEGLEKRMDKLEAEFASQKDLLIAEGKQLAGEASSWEEKYRTALQEREAEEEKRMEEAKASEEKVAALEEKLRSLQEHQVENAKLKEEVERLKAAAPVPVASMSLEEASAIYKESEDFRSEMGEYGDMGFQVLKAALVKDGKVSEEDLNAYDYMKVMVRVHKGEI